MLKGGTMNKRRYIVNKILFFVLCICVVFTCSSCRSVSGGNQENSARAVHHRGQMTSVGKAMLDAFRDDDYTAFSRELPPDLQKQFSELSFDEGRRQVISSAGNMVKYRYLGMLSGPVFKSDLWAVEFLRNSKDGKAVVQEILFKLTSAADNGKFQVVSFGFML